MDVPNLLAPLERHGVVFSNQQGDQFIGGCPFCDKEDHFFVGDTGKWDCKVCGLSGNVVSFLGMIVDHWRKRTPKGLYEDLGKDRGIPASVLRRWGLAFDGQDWLIPIRTIRGTVSDIRIHHPGSRIISTKGCKLGLFGVEQLVDPKRSEEIVYLCEGEWDTMAMDYLLRKMDQKGICVGVPGAAILKPEWTQYFLHRNVVLLYDNDEAGDAGSKKAADRLSGSAADVKFLHWPDTRPTGYDIRDMVKELSPEDAWEFLEKNVHDHHRRFPPAGGGASGGGGGSGRGIKVKKRAKKIPSFAEVLQTYQKWLKLDANAILALKIMFAVVISNRVPGDPVWLFIVAPPGSGKTALLTTLSDSDHCVFRSSCTPASLVSGFQMNVDPSLIPRLDGKVFVLKDYTEVLSMVPQMQEELYAILRGAYDGRVEKSFGNGILRDYTSHFSMIAGVTHQIHGNSRATLGERFLKYQMMNKTVFDVTDQIMAAVGNISRESAMEDELRGVATLFVSKPIPENVVRNIPEDVKVRIVALVQLIAMLRAEVDREVYAPDIIKRRPQQEVGTRLAKQLLKLGIALAVVEDKPEIDEEVYRMMERVAFDTAIGFHLDIVAALMALGGKATRDDLISYTGLPVSNLVRQIDDLILLKIIRREESTTFLGNGRKYMYYATPRVKELWERAKVTIKLGSNRDVRRIKRKRT